MKQVFRDDAVYVERNTRIGLSYAKPEETTLDEFANQILADHLKEKYPDVVNHMRAVDELNQQFRKLKQTKPE